MRRATSRLALLALLLLCRQVFAGSAVTIPDWVRTTAAQQQGAYPPRTNAVVLLDDTKISVSGPGQYLETYRRVVRILRPEGRDEGIVQLYLKHGDKIQNLHAWSIDKDGHQFEVKDKDFLETSPYDGILYSDIRLRAAKVPAAGVGTIVAFEYSIERSESTSELRWYFQKDLPVVAAQFTLELPQGYQYKSWWTNRVAEQPAQLNPTSWQWTETNVSPITQEDYRPATRAIAGRMDLAYYSSSDAPASTFASWQDIGAWYDRLTAGRRDVTPAITDKVHALTANVSGFDATVRALARFMQTNIRYVAVEIGVGGYQPHPAADVFRYDYGDCKDKATLLSAMLSVANIRSDYVLINTSHGVIQPGAPTTAFDHAILAIDLPPDAPASYRSVITAPDGKRYLLFDPTDSYTPVGELNESLQGNYGLLVAGGKGELVQLPLLPPAATLLNREGTFALAADGTLTGDVTERRTGHYAWLRRNEMMDSDDADRTRIMENYLNTFLTGMTLQQSSMDHLADLGQPLVFRYKITAPGYGQNSGSMLIVRPRVIGDKYLSIAWKNRKYPVDLGGTSDETDTFDIAIPAGYKVDDVPDPMSIDIGFASYTSKVEVIGSTLHYHREYIVKQPLVGVDHLGDLRRLENAISGDETSSVILVKQ